MAQDEFRELVRKRNALRAELDAHLAACIAREPHGYFACQLTRERMEERLERLEEQIRRVTKLRLL